MRKVKRDYRIGVDVWQGARFYPKEKKYPKEYCKTEQIWRLFRSLFLILGTGLWLFTDITPYIIFGSFLIASGIDQFHGYICHRIEKILHYKEQHEDWE